MKRMIQLPDMSWVDADHIVGVSSSGPSVTVMLKAKVTSLYLEEPESREQAEEWRDAIARAVAGGMPQPAPAAETTDWIALPGHAPPPNEPVLAYCASGTIGTGSCVPPLRAGEPSSLGKVIWIVGGQKRTDVTHWQPLPDPPAKP